MLSLPHNHELRRLMSSADYFDTVAAGYRELGNPFLFILPYQFEL